MQSTVTETIERATLEVFALMVGVDIIPQARDYAASRKIESSVVSSFQLSGAVCGTAEVYYTLPLARWITCQMLQMEPPVAEIDVLDAAGEVANVIVGSVKSSLESYWGSVRIGTPTVAISAVEAEANRAMRVTFRCRDDVFTVSVAFHEDIEPWEN